MDPTRIARRSEPITIHIMLRYIPTLSTSTFRVGKWNADFKMRWKKQQNKFSIARVGTPLCLEFLSISYFGRTITDFKINITIFTIDTFFSKLLNKLCFLTQNQHRTYFCWKNMFVKKFKTCVFSLPLVQNRKTKGIPVWPNSL